MSYKLQFENVFFSKYKSCKTLMYYYFKKIKMVPHGVKIVIVVAAAAAAAAVSFSTVSRLCGFC